MLTLKLIYNTADNGTKDVADLGGIITGALINLIHKWTIFI